MMFPSFFCTARCKHHKDQHQKQLFLQIFKRVTTAEPVNGYLGLGKDGKFYWIYYAGMGSMAFHPVQDEHDPVIKVLLKSKELEFNDKLFHVPFHDRSIDKLRTASFFIIKLNTI